MNHTKFQPQPTRNRDSHPFAIERGASTERESVAGPQEAREKQTSSRKEEQLKNIYEKISRFVEAAKKLPFKARGGYKGL